MNQFTAPWTPENDHCLRQHYGVISISQMIALNILPGRTERAIRLRAFRIGLKSKLHYVTPASHRHDFFATHTAESAYWAGFLAADGSLIKSPNKPNTYRLCLSLASKDEDHLMLFKRTMRHTGKVTTAINKDNMVIRRNPDAPRTVMKMINLCQVGRFLKDLEALGIIPNKTRRIPPPLLVDPLLRLAYLKGYIDGDGSLAVGLTGDKIGNVTISLVSSCRVILEWFKTVIDELFPTSYLNREYSNFRPSDNSDAWTYAINGYRALRIIEALQCLPTPELARKWRNPAVLEAIQQGRQNPLWAEEWGKRLPIDDAIDAHLAAHPDAVPTPTGLTVLPERVAA